MSGKLHLGGAVFGSELSWTNLWVKEMGRESISSAAGLPVSSVSCSDGRPWEIGTDMNVELMGRRTLLVDLCMRYSYVLIRSILEISQKKI